jgi:hypothetical protein
MDHSLAFISSGCRRRHGDSRIREEPWIAVPSLSSVTRCDTASALLSVSYLSSTGRDPERRGSSYPLRPRRFRVRSRSPLVGGFQGMTHPNAPAAGDTHRKLESAGRVPLPSSAARACSSILSDGCRRAGAHGPSTLVRDGGERAGHFTGRPSRACAELSLGHPPSQPQLCTAAWQLVLLYALDQPDAVRTRRCRTRGPVMALAARDGAGAIAQEVLALQAATGLTPSVVRCTGGACAIRLAATALAVFATVAAALSGGPSPTRAGW